MVAGSIARSSSWGRRIVAAAVLARLMRMVDDFILFRLVGEGAVSFGVWLCGTRRLWGRAQRVASNERVES